MDSEHDSMRGVPTRAEMRAALVKRQGEALVSAFERSTVAVCGLGGLGSAIALSLARAGVGRLILIDFDRLDVTNLHRQQYLACQVGRPKAEALTENLRQVAPYVEYVPHVARVTEENAATLLAGAAVVCEAFDVAAAKAMLAETVLTRLPEADLVTGTGMAGIGPGNRIVTRRVGRRMYVCGDGETDVAEAGSLVAPRVMLCASHQALVTLRLLAGLTDV